MGFVNPRRFFFGMWVFFFIAACGGESSISIEQDGGGMVDGGVTDGSERRDADGAFDGSVLADAALDANDETDGEMPFDAGVDLDAVVAPYDASSLDAMLSPDAASTFDAGEALDAAALEADASIEVDAASDASETTPDDASNDAAESPCPSGYEGTLETTCSDIDECMLGFDDCSEEERCENLAGSYACARSIHLGVGHYQTCAIVPDGGVKCWGDWNGFSLAWVPTPLGPFAAAASRFVGSESHACVLLVDGKVYCSGQNFTGEVGDGTTEAREEPVLVNVGGFAIDIAVGVAHTCAALEDGSVKCWGNGPAGQLGDGAMWWSPVPTPTRPLAGAAKRVVAGAYHTCALLDDGGVQCWGNNAEGELGDGSTENRASPVSTADFGDDVVDLVAGGSHTCAVLASGSVKCWGWNEQGQLGDGTYESRTAPTVAVPVGARAIRATAGNNHTCALLEDGAVKCWGWNDVGQLGDGTRSDRSAPVGAVALGEAATDVVAGWQHTCARLASGTVKCWGRNVGLGYGPNYRMSPTSVTRIAEGPTHVASGGTHSCALMPTGFATCWGNNGSGQLGVDSVDEHGPFTIDVGEPTERFVLGANYSCALSTSGLVRCWGSNSYGCLGDGSNTNRTSPTPTAPLGAAAIDIAAGSASACAVLAGGTVKCWGNSAQGRLGNGVTTPSIMAPVATASLGGAATRVVVGSQHACAVLADGTVRCWGTNGSGQLGDGSTTMRSVPTPTLPLDGEAVEVVVGYAHSCARLDDGRVECWGSNDSGQLGDGTTTRRTSPTLVSLEGAALSLVSGDNHVCALLDDGTLACWGLNNVGQLGDGTTMRRTVPTATVPLEGPVRTLVGGSLHACAVLEDERLFCWGSNFFGQLANDDLTGLVLTPPPYGVPL